MHRFSFYLASACSANTVRYCIKSIRPFLGPTAVTKFQGEPLQCGHGIKYMSVENFFANIALYLGNGTGIGP